MQNQRSITEKVTEHTMKELEEIDKTDREKLLGKKAALLKIQDESNRRVEDIKALLQVFGIKLETEKGVLFEMSVALYQDED